MRKTACYFNSGHNKTGEGTMLDKEKLFNRFYKQSGNSDSWGLGLAIAKKLQIPVVGNFVIEVMEPCISLK